jgi:hypothetical protein
MSEVIPKQKLYPMLALGRMICGRCCDGVHKYCEGYECTCACRDPRPARHPPIMSNRDGLSAEEQRAQASFAFDSSEPLTIEAETLKKGR